MRGKKLLTKVIAAVLCVLSLSACLQASARETTYSCDYLQITCDGFVADTFLGVEARYNRVGPTIYCTELIPRFYREVYGVDISVGGGHARVTDKSGYWFEEVEEARPGDILFAPGAARGKSYNHWAICKATDPEADQMTLFEQNWRWNGCAGINRVIPLHGSCYRVFRMVSGEGPVQTIAEKERQEAAVQTVVQVSNELSRQVFETAALVL